MIGWIITIIVLAGLGIGGRVGWAKLQKEHAEAKRLPIKAIHFNRLKNGTYHGAYAGGMYGWRANECDVTVDGGKVTGIQLAMSLEDPNGKHKHYDMLYERVIAAQSLQVDTISGSTLTSKAFLKAVENALVQAE